MQNFLHNMDWAVAIRSDILTPIFNVFTLMGYSGFLLLLVSVGYWLISKNAFARVGLFLLLSALLNEYLKGFFQDPRPDVIFRLDAKVGESFGFPSGHSQIAVIVWFWLAWEYRKTWGWIASSILVVGICFSRLYLGAHDVEDVLGGVGIGLISLLVFMFLTSKRFEWWKNINPIWRVVAIILIETAFFLTWPGKLQEPIIGYGVFLVGFWIGVNVNKRRIRFFASMDWRKIVCASVVGLVGFFALRKGLPELGSALNLDGTIFRLLTQGLILSFYITAIAPWIFQILKLGDKETIVMTS